eukprot:9630414-Ditylum_brightwellii.AAC.1
MVLHVPTPITNAMVVLSQNFPSWLDSLDMQGCQDIRIIVNNTWDVVEREWVKSSLESACPNVTIYNSKGLYLWEKSDWVKNRWWLDGDWDWIQHWLKISWEKGWKDTKFSNVIFVAPWASFKHNQTNNNALITACYDMSKHVTHESIGGVTAVQ